jgi:hypothetical protein
MSNKKIVIFLVGVGTRDWGDKVKKLADMVTGKTEDAFLDGLNTTGAPEKVDAEFETRYFQGFRHLAGECWESSDIDLICIGDYHPEIGFSGVMDGLAMLPAVLADHPNRPAIYLLDKRMYPLAESLIDAGVKVIADDPKDFWQFVAERYALKSNREEALQ